MSGKLTQAKAWTRGICYAALLVGVMPTVALAQEGIEVVTVTAQKRAESVQDVPISMTVLSGSKLAGLHVRDIKSLQDYVPNLMVARTGVDDVVYMRGFGSGVNNVAFDMDVSMYKDGIYGGRSAQFTAPFFDVERMEVLRGPQGARFGKNTAAGAISIITAGPTDTFEAAVTAGYNVIQSGPEVEGHVAGPITDTLGGRLAFKYLNQDGFLHNNATGKDDPQTEQVLGRATLKWQPMDGLDSTLKLEYGKFGQRGSVTQSNSCAQLPGAAPNGCANIPRHTLSDDRFAPDPYINGISENNKIISHTVGLTTNYQIGDHTLTWIAGYSRFNTARLSGYDMTNADGVTVSAGNGIYANAFPEHFEQYSQEVRLLSPSDQTLEYIIGGYWDSSTYNLYQTNNYNGLPTVPPTTGVSFTNYQQSSVSYSAFVDATWHITDDLRLKGSARYSTTTKSGALSQGLLTGTMRAAYMLGCGGANLAAPVNSVGCIFQGTSGHLGENSFDPSATIQYDVTKDIMVYANWARGSKSGGFVSNTYALVSQGIPFRFQPERSTNYELGAKTTLDDGRIILNATLYYMTVKNLQTSAYDPARQTFITGNAASATSKGVEFEGQWAPIEGLDFAANVAYLDAVYDDFPGAGCLADEPASVCSSAVLPSAPNSVANHNIKGHVLQYASKWTGTFTVHHSMPVFDGYKLDTTVTGMLRSKFYMADTLSEIYGLQPTVMKWDFRLQFGDVDEKWNVAVVGKNIFNIKTVANTIQFPGSITLNPRGMSWVDERRQVIIEGTYHF